MITLAICAVLVAVLLPALRAEAAEVQPMKSSDEMIEVLKRMEGFSPYPHWDYGQYSIGYGTKCPEDKRAEYEKTGITEEKAQELLEAELAAFEKNVSDFARTYNLKLSKNQFDALVSFTYNCGPSWMSDKTGYFNNAVRSGDLGSDLIYGMCLFSTAGSDYILIERRMCEANMYINGVYKASNDENAVPENYKWVFLDGNGGKVRYSIYGYDAAKKPTVSVQFSEIPTGVDANGKSFAYTLAGWYTFSGTKVDNLTTALSNGQKLYAKWKDPDGNIVNLTGKQETVEKKITVTNSKVNVRSGPGLSYNIVTTVSEGTKLTVKAVQEADGYVWGKTEKGWLSLTYTDYFDSSNEETSSGTFPKTGTVNSSDVRYRTEAPSGTVVGSKQIGDKVTITQEKTISGIKWGKMSDGYWICLDYVTYDDKKVTAIELISKPIKLKYADTKQPLKLEGSVLLVTHADGTSVAMTLNRDMVTSFKATSADKATVTISHGGKTLSFQVTLGKTGDVIITKQPAGAFAESGKQAMTTVTATGDGLKYQWYFRNAGDSAYSKSSITENSYYMTMKPEVSGRKVYCVVTDKYGDSVKSDVVTMAIKPTITKQPVNVFVDNGAKASVSLTAVGDGLKYQWYFRNAGVTEYSKSSITTNTYTTTMDATRSGRQVYCEITDSYGHKVKSNVVVLGAKPQITSQPSCVYAPNGAKVTATIKATGEGLQYAWYIRNAGATSYSKSSVTANTYSVTMKDSISGRKIYCVVTDKYGNTVKSQEILFINRIMITQQPKHATVSLGEKATVSVTALGDGLKYQWYYKNAGVSSYTKSSTTTNTYAMTVDATRSGRQVYCVVTDKNGNSVKSDVVTLAAKAAITAQPKNVSAVMGKEVKTSVAAVGVGLRYEWYFKNAGASSYSKSSITTNTYTMTVDATRSGRQVYCVVTDKYGNSVKSNVVTLTAKVSITAQPKNVSAVMGKEVKTSVAAVGVGLRYEWYFKNAGASSYSKSSITTNTYTMTLDATRSGRQVYCVVTDKYGNSVKSNVVTLTAKVSITAQPKNASAAMGKEVKTSVTATGVGLKYEWYFKNAGASSYSKSSITTNTYTMTLDATRSGRQVYCVVTDKYGNSVKSNVVTLTAKVSITAQPKNASAAMGKEVKTSVTATGVGLKYQWYFRNAGVTEYSESSITTNTYTMTLDATRSGRQVYCVVTDKYGNSVKSNVVTLTAKVSITAQPKNASAAMGKEVKTSVTATGVGLKYQWYFRNAGVTEYSESSVTTNTYTMTLDATRSGRQVYCVVTDKHGNSVKSNVVTLSANLTIVKQPENASADMGTQVTTRVQASGAGLQYQWYYCEFGSDTFFKSGLKGTEYYVTIKQANAGRKVYCVITDKHGQSVKTDVVTLMANSAITRQPESKTMAVGQRFSTTVEAVGVDLRYQWYICAPKTDLYIKSSLTGPEYYVTAKESTSGRLAYCEITDRHGNILKSDVVTITTVDPAKELRSQLEARNPQIVITYLQNEKLPDDSLVAVDVFNDAIAHTGIGTQGDYIYRHIKNLAYESHCEKQGDDYLVTLTYTVGYRASAEQEAQVDAKVKEILDELNVYNATDYKKVKAVYDYLCQNVTVDYAIPGLFAPAPIAHTAYGALVENSAVCQGVANAFYRLMLELDVDVRLISGKVGSTSHGWNIVAIDGIYYNVDATKDAGFPTDQYHCFLKADSSLTNYVRDAEYCTEEFMTAYPMAQTNYQ